jgi:hypothetical protein
VSYGGAPYCSSTVINDVRRIARFRARAAACNWGPMKGDCTDSDTGREMERELDEWPRLEVTRFELRAGARACGPGDTHRQRGAGAQPRPGGRACAWRSYWRFVARVGRQMIFTGLDRR